MNLSEAMRWLEIVQIIGGVIDNCLKKLEEVKQPGFDVNKINLAELKAELVSLPDLPEKL
jgi:hypothetical protein